MNKKAIHNYLELGIGLKPVRAYRMYLILIMMFLYTILATLHYEDYIYLGIFFSLGIAIMVFVPVDIALNKHDYYHVKRDSALLYILFLVEWDNVIFYNGLMNLTNRTAIFILLICMQILILVVCRIALRRFVSKFDKSINNKSISSRQVMYFVLLGILVFWPIVFAEINIYYLFTFGANSIVSIGILYEIANKHLQSRLFKELKNYI